MAQEKGSEIPDFGGLGGSALPDSSSQDRPGWTLKKIARMLGILVALTGAAFALTLYVLKPMFVVKAQPEDSSLSGKLQPGRILPLDPTVVNIAGTNGRRYLKATVQIEIPDDGKAMKKVQARKAVLADHLIRILSSKPLEELTGTGSLDRLKQEIADQLSKELGADRLQAVYLTEFVIQ